MNEVKVGTSGNEPVDIGQPVTYYCPHTSTTFNMPAGSYVSTSTQQVAPPKPVELPIRNLVIVSDLHCGCRLGLHPDKPSPLNDGGTYSPSKLQQKIWSYWQEFWQSWVPMVTRGEPFAVLVNGDSIDGCHHNSTSQISHDLSDQTNIAYSVLEPIRDLCKGQLYFTRGTEAHVGPSGVEEERLARALGAIPDEAGRYSRYEIWLRLGKALIHATHHIGTTSSASHEASAVNSELISAYTEAARWGDEIPDFVVRSHRHRFIGIDLDCSKGLAASLVTPGWQAKTSFVYKIAGGRMSQPQFGGVLIREGDEEHYYRRKIWTIQRPSEVTL